MTLSIFDRFITQVGSGITVPLAELTVNMTGASTGLATLWLDRAGTIPAGNPVTADADGRIQFYAEPARYNMSASFGCDTVTYPNVLIGAEDATDIPLTIGGTTTNVSAWANDAQPHISYRAASLESFSAIADGSDVTTEMQSAFDSSRNLFAGSELSSPNYKTTVPIKIRSATKLKGLGQQIVRQGATEVDYSSFTKSTNTTVTVENPEIADQIVDCHFYLDGQWTDSVYTQKVEISDASFRSTAASAVNTGLYCIQGGNYTLRNVDFFDYVYAVDGYDVWSCLCEKIVSNSLVSFRRGTSIKLDQCASGGTGNGGVTRGGFRFDTIRDSELDVCTSDGSSDTAYYFTSCRGIVMTACAMENGASTSDDYGIALHIDNSIMEVNGFYAVCNEHATHPTFSIGSSVKADLSNIECVYRYSGGTFGAPNYDIAVTGNGSVVTFRNTLWGGTGTGYDSPKIRFNSGVTSSIVVVYGVSTSDRRPKVYYSDGTGATLSKYGLIDYGTNSNGTYVRFDDGTQMCWLTASKTLFENTGSSASAAAQGISFYRSAVLNWTYPAAFVNSSAPHVYVTPRTGTTGTRLCWPRVSSGGSNATSGDIQLIGVEDFITAAVGYTNLTDVQLFAVGRYY